MPKGRKHIGCRLAPLPDFRQSVFGLLLPFSASFSSCRAVGRRHRTRRACHPQEYIALRQRLEPPARCVDWRAEAGMHASRPALARLLARLLLPPGQRVTEGKCHPDSRHLIGRSRGETRHPFQLTWPLGSQTGSSELQRTRVTGTSAISGLQQCSSRPAIL